jgi:Flp pilus assembly protein TadG
MSRLGDERGQVTAMWAILALALLVLGGLVYDGGQILTARRDANNLARQAARAGAQQLDEDSIRAGNPTLDPVAAEAAARQFLARRSVTPTFVDVQGSTVTVTVTMTQPTPLLALVGIDDRTVTSTASARSARGVTGEGS